MNLVATSEGTDLGFTGSKGGRVVRYPKIRLERSSSHQRLPRGNHQTFGDVRDPQGIEGNPSEMDGQSMDIEDGCTFNIRREPRKRQPHFKISFSQNGDPPTVQDISLGNGQVMIIGSKYIIMVVYFKVYTQALKYFKKFYVEGNCNLLVVCNLGSSLYLSYESNQ